MAWKKLIAKLITHIGLVGMYILLIRFGCNIDKEVTSAILILIGSTTIVWLIGKFVDYLFKEM